MRVWGFFYCGGGCVFVLAAQLPEASREIGPTYDEWTSGELLYYWARYYDPVLKRFISEDPIGMMGGANLYTYVGGNPISLIDPEGKFFFEMLHVPHLVWGYGMAGITLGSAAFIVGYGIGTAGRLTVEWMIGDSIGGKWHDFWNPLPPMNVQPVPPGQPPMPPATPPGFPCRP